MQEGQKQERAVFQKEGVENGSNAAEKLCPTRGPLELTFRLDRLEVTGDCDDSCSGITETNVRLGWIKEQRHKFFQEFDVHGRK